MTEHSKFSCDGCEKDLTSTGNCTAYRLTLKVESIPANAGFVTLMHFSPPLDSNKHFCDLGCLGRWWTNFIGEKRKSDIESYVLAGSSISALQVKEEG